MGIVKSAVLYTALVLGANAATAQAADISALREGDMKKLVVHDDPRPASDKSFSDADGGDHSLADYEGQVVLLNFWATWCAPCREEMPALDSLQAEMGGDDFQVVPVATGRNSLTGIRKFFEEEGVEALPIRLDPKQALAREMAVLGLPITVLLNRAGQEIARLQGDADWASDSARAIISEVISAGGDS
ncbi:TlpA disulfide reductase family protein [Tranquillimonas rosea]|uniref:TlpA disulfide reductase family protein n=1 Tax=Tranquillimonas rosea TaxID=641238 RepID=UPI003BAD8717